MKKRNYIIEPVPGSGVSRFIVAIKIESVPDSSKIESVPDSVLRYLVQPGTGWPLVANDIQRKIATRYGLESSP